MLLNRASLAVAAAILLLGWPVTRADDGKPDQAGPAAQAKDAPPSAPRPESAPSPERAKEILREALKLIQSLADEAARKEREFSFPSPAEFTTRFKKDQHADTLRAIGRAHARLGDVPAARAAWPSALDAAAGITFVNSSLGPTSNPAAMFSGIAEAQIEAGERDEARFSLRQALQAARSVQSGLPFPLPPPPGMEFSEDQVAKKADVLRQIAQLQAKAGEAARSEETFRLAVETADSIKLPFNKVQELVKIAGGSPSEKAEAIWAKALDFALAQEEFVRAQGVSAHLRARIDAGQIEPALATITGRLKGDLHAYGLWVFADAVASSDAAIPAEVMDRVARLAQKAEYDRPSKKLTVYQRIAEAQARLGAYDAAYRTVGEPHPANNVQDFRATHARIQVMAAVAQAQLKAEQRGAAKDTAHSALELIAFLGNEDAEAYFPLSRLGHLLAQAGDSRGAFDIVDALSYAMSKTNLLTEIATVQAQDKQDEAARATIRRAIEASRRAPNDATWGLAGNPPDLDPMAPIRKTIALAQARIGDLDAAFKTISAMGQGSFAVFARKELAEKIVELRIDTADIAGARRAADLIIPADVMLQDDKANLLERIALRQAKEHDPALVLDWARKKATPRARLQVLRGLANGLAERFDPKAEPSKPAGPSGQPQPKPAGP
jgi:tetratricopeptide (TPR) repeat protein